MAEIIIPSFDLENEVVLSITPKTASGADAVVDGVPVWSGSENLILTPAEDGLSCVATPTAPGPFSVKAEADADLDADEVRFIEVNFVGLCTPVEAQSLDGGFVIQPKA